MKKNLLIICGGKSHEHEVSLLSAQGVLQNIDTALFTPFVISVSTSGTWYLLPHTKNLFDIKQCTDSNPVGEICGIVRLPSGSVVQTINNSNIKIDVVFPLIHGEMGEDGSLQGLLEMMYCPYVGSGTLSSALCMDKVVCKQLLANYEIPQAPFLILQNGQHIKYEQAVADLQSQTLFIKPSSAGSSIGVSKVESEDQYEKAIEIAMQYDAKIVVEKAIVGREVECAVFGYNKIKASVLGEIELKDGNFYSYHAKYIDANIANLKVNPVFRDSIKERVQELAMRVFKILNCQGMARVDFFVDEDSIYLNEINTIPGFTPISMYPVLWEASGIKQKDLITNLIQSAL